MSVNVIQTSFHAGEWAPALNARVDLQKYHAAAALLNNFFVDYRGGASSCPGTKYILRAYKSSTAVRLIPFAASFTVNYVLEFGDFYIRFYNNGAPVLETALALTAATAANPAVFTRNAHGLSTGDWVFTSLFAGGTWSTLNGKYFIVAAATANTFQLTDLFGNAVSGVGLGTWTAGSVARVYTIASPYAAADLALLKFAQNVDTLILCHPSYSPYILTLNSATDWSLVPIVIGTTVVAPATTSIATTTGGPFVFSYIVTSVDINGQESIGTVPNTSSAIGTGATITLSWPAAAGATSYNIYRTSVSTLGAPPAGSAFGFVANVTGLAFDDYIQANGVPFNPADFAETLPIVRNPFIGAGVTSVSVSVPGTYTTAPGVTIAPPSSGTQATAYAVLQVQGTPTIGAGGAGYAAGQTITLSNGVVVVIATVTAGPGVILTFEPISFPGSNRGNVTGSTPANPVAQVSSSGGGAGATVNLVWGVGLVIVTNPGSGYTTTPAVTFSAGAAAAVAAPVVPSVGNPTVPSYFQQRLVLAGPSQSPQTFHMSQPGSYYNFNVTNPTQPDDAITGTIVSAQLNSIKALIPMPTGLIALGDKQAFLISGGTAQTPITPIDVTAKPQAYSGANDVPPLVVNYDIIYVQAKSSYVRNTTYDFDTNVYRGTDISILSSHLFFGYQILEWAYAEEPFKLVWAVRNDGILLSMAYVKEQELIGWAHRDTQGLFKSICSITETVTLSSGTEMSVDAIYVVVQRTVNATTVQYIERMVERIFPNGAEDAWCVDSGLQYNGAPASSFTGGEHLRGKTIVGVADGVAITPFTMAATGNFTLPAPASIVTVGLAYTPQLQTLALDVGEPTVQGKQKKIASVTVRCQETLGLSIGSDFDNLVAMKDLVVGNVGSLTNEAVTDLVTGDAQTVIDPKWSEQGQFCIQQDNPLPATILGVIPEIVIGDTK